jgi:hypothetical protein
MAAVSTKAVSVGRKKRSIPARTVKLDGDLVHWIGKLADDEGIDKTRYLSDLIRPIVEREWTKLQKRTLEGGE